MNKIFKLKLMRFLGYESQAKTRARILRQLKQMKQDGVMTNIFFHGRMK